MHLINPNPKTDWRIDQECFDLITHSKQIGKAIVVGVDPVKDRVHLYNSSLEYTIIDHMDRIFENESDAMEALREAFRREPEERALNPKARTDWSAGQECFFPLGGYVHKGSITGVDPAAAQASVHVCVSRSWIDDSLGNEEDIYADGEPKEVVRNTVVNMNSLFDNEDDVKLALIKLAGKA